MSMISGGLWWPGVIAEVSHCKRDWNGKNNGSVTVTPEFLWEISTA